MLKVPCGDVAGGGTCGYYAVMLQEAVRAVTTRRTYSAGCLTPHHLPYGNRTLEHTNAQVYS